RSQSQPAGGSWEITYFIAVEGLDEVSQAAAGRIRREGAFSVTRVVPAALVESEAEVWVLPTGNLPPEQEEAMHELLDPAEKARAERFAFARDRRDLRFAHGLLRLLLSAALPRDPRDWRIRPGAGGKPELVEGQAANLYFNISHTRGCVACLVGRRPMIGVDVESRERRTAMEVGERLFAPAEVA